MLFKNLFNSGKAKLILAGIAVCSVTAIIITTLIQSESSQNYKFDEAFRPYISGFTSGIISSESPILITFTSEVARPDQFNHPIDEKLFDIKPGIQGTTSWINSNTIRFVPDKSLKSGEAYKVSFNMGAVMSVPDNLKKFPFSFQIMQQYFDVQTEGLHFYEDGSRNRQKLSGTILTADVASGESVEKILSATQNNTKLPIRWNHNGDRLTHFFEIENIARGEKPGSVTLNWNGAPIEADLQGSLDYEIPALGNFELLSANVVQNDEQYVRLEFSDLLDAIQDLRGLIALENAGDIRTIIENNIIRVYPSVRQTGVKSIVLNENIKNTDSKPLGKTQRLDILFEELKPSLQISDKGVILPSTDGMIFPFEAVSLKSVNVKITKIHSGNINQFFQVNTFTGNREVKRVGSVVVQKTVALNNTNPNDYSRLKKYALNLTELIQTEPGAAYQIKLSFNKKNTWYNCPEESNQTESSFDTYDGDENYDEPEYSYWDYDYDYYYYPPDYDYQERDNPCSNSYYGDWRSVTKNIFASDLGIIAKKGSNNKLTIAVTDLLSAKPQSNAIVEVYDYQQQLLTSNATNQDGIVSLSPARQPFFLIVKKDSQRGYLKLDDGSSLSVTSFDVSGQKIQKGLKGYIYGERGVWRPGDSLHLTFILENKLENNTGSHPVIFELQNPQGQIVKRMVNGTPKHNFYYFPTATDEDAPTGNWIARMKVGGAEFTRLIKIETIKPNRLKIKVDFGKEKITSIDQQISGNMEVKWLHGAVAKNLKANVELKLTQTTTSFPKFAEYTFDDPGRIFQSEQLDIFNDKIDQNGKAVIKARVHTEGTAPGALNANFRIRVFEEGGDFSTDQFSIPYYPYSSYVGIRVPQGDAARNMLLTDTSHTISLVTIDDNGKPVSGRKLDMQLYKLDWKWWWDNSENDLSNILESNYKRPIQTGSVTSSNGKASWQLRINYPEWGRYYLRVYDNVSKHSSGKIIYVDWPGWAGKSKENTNGSHHLLSFTADKEKYAVGEDISLAIPGSAGGRALISVENGSNVIETHWFETQNGKNTFTFKASEAMAPGVYINITLLQPHANTANDHPIRLYGIIPVKVENKNSILKPIIETPETYKPEETASISVSEANGQPMTYTLAVVDEGLLDLTRFKTPDPWSEFYAREALGVKSFDMYEYVIGALGQKINRLISIGGDAELRNKDAGKAKRFPPVVRYMGPFELAQGKTATHSFRMPQYIGSVRVMAIAGNPSGAYGHAEKAVPVRKPLMVLATLPRVLGPEEYVALPVNIFAMTPQTKSVQVEVKTDKLIDINDNSKKTIHFSTPGDEVVNFYLKAKAATGTSKILVTATSGSEKATYEINIEIRNPNSPITKTEEKILSAGETASFTHSVFGVSGSNKTTLEVSSIPPVNLEKRLQYLIQYPYGCIEQTTSAAFPQLYVLELTQPENGLAGRIQANVNSAINRLKSFQLPEGGFSYWPGMEDYNSWSTSYVGHFMLEAEKKGYVLPVGMKSQWIKFQRKASQNWTDRGNNSDLSQAYRLFTLALAGEPETGAMNRLREMKNLSATAAWQLAAAYTLAGQDDAANSLISTNPRTIPSYQEMSNNFGSTTRDKAVILYVMGLMKKHTAGMAMLKEVSQALSSESWMSTQETAYCLLAVSKFLNSGGIKSSSVSFTYQPDNDKIIKGTTDLKIAQVSIPLSAKEVSIKNTSDGSLYFRLIRTGTPAAGQEETSNNNITLKVSYKNKEGHDIDPAILEQGTDFIAEVSIYNPGSTGTLQNVALKQIFPSGWEIHNYRMDAGMSQQAGSIPTYQDIRDDRVYTFFDLPARSTKTFRIMLNAAYLGKFYLPSVYAEVMYNGSTNALVPGKWVEVVSPGSDGFSMME